MRITTVHIVLALLMAIVLAIAFMAIGAVVLSFAFGVLGAIALAWLVYGVSKHLLTGRRQRDATASGPSA